MTYFDEAQLGINELQNRCLPSPSDTPLPTPLIGEIELPAAESVAKEAWT